MKVIDYKQYKPKKLNKYKIDKVQR